jgi:ABC-type glycerol-3-phosphate transport system permease component
MTSLRLIDTYWAILLPAFASSLGLYIMTNFIGQIPDSLIEAAKLDGASEFSIFWKIIMPNTKPGWLTLGVFSFQALWNNTNSTYIYKEELKPLSFALNQIVSGGIERAGAGAAVAVVMMIVPIIVFVITQSNIMETMASSGIKE